MGKKTRRDARLRKNKTKKRKVLFAAKLEKNVPKSELWFRELYKPFHHYADEYNTVFGGYIPDVINKHYKYIIEIDGSIHDLIAIKNKDIKKDKRYHSVGYKVIRIRAYNNQSFNDGMNEICIIRGPYYKPAKILSRNEIKKLTSSSN